MAKFNLVLQNADAKYSINKSGDFLTSTIICNSWQWSQPGPVAPQRHYKQCKQIFLGSFIFR